MPQCILATAVLLLFVLPARAANEPPNLDLAGTWQFALDPDKVGLKENWQNGDFRDSIQLPGTTDEAKKGKGNANISQTMHLSRAFPYIGPAWYQREVTFPGDWKGRRVTLLLERTMDVTVWLDDRLCGQQNSLAGMQVYQLGSDEPPGSHRLTICVDNSKKPPVNGSPHQYTDDTQTIWNGIIGRIELRATDRVWMEDVQVYPDVANHRAKVRVTLGNESGGEVSGRIELSARHSGVGRFRVPPAMTATFAKAGNGATVESEYDLGPDAVTWDEFDPAMYRLSLNMQATAGAVSFSDHRELDFGLREFKAKGTQFAINGKTIFLRGKHDACVFPLTGHPPMDVDGWVRVFKIAKDYGINHYRFHSWCPPDAAFAAADIVGMYLQPELPNFGGDIGRNPAVRQYSLDEGKRILAAFGNHPSFVMLSVGNELWGGVEARAAIVKELRQLDPRHLYAQGSNDDLGAWKLLEGDDYWTTVRTGQGADHAVRGSFAHCDAPLGHVQVGPPGTMYDYSKAIAGVPIPVIGHEVGQYQVYPNFEEMKKYTGVLKPWNFEVFRQRLKDKGMLDQARDFFEASGALTAICYREEIETALRTKGFGGFQLLDLQDFPGQGTALVGILDAFMDSKNLVEPKTWRQFCGPVVPLALVNKRTFTTDETLTAQIKVANYGPLTRNGERISWWFSGVEREKTLWGELPPMDLPQGSLTSVGEIRIPLTGIKLPQMVWLEVYVGGFEIQNHYEFWVYPAKPQTQTPPNVLVSREMDEKTLKTLADGGRVLLLPEPAKLKNSVEGFFAPDFWCYPMFRGISQRAKKPVAPGTLGLLCDPRHPALEQFPTDPSSNWQWFDLTMHSRPIILDSLPAGYKPIVQVIDNFERNHKLGLVFSLKVGKGRLLVCSCDLLGLKDKPEARQLLASLLSYAASDRFNPKAEIDAVTLLNLIK